MSGSAHPRQLASACSMRQSTLPCEAVNQNVPEIEEHKTKFRCQIDERAVATRRQPSDAQKPDVDHARSSCPCRARERSYGPGSVSSQKKTYENLLTLKATESATGRAPR